MDRIIEWIAEQLRISTHLTERIVVTLVTLLVIWLIRRLVLAFVYRRTDDFKSRYSWNKGTVYVAYILAFLLVGRVWFDGISSLATYLGLLSAGLALALRDPIVNIAGWLFIIWRRPFEVGDRIQIGSYAGDVIDQRMFQFTILEIGNWVDADQSTGRIIHIPNGKIFSSEQANYTKAFTYIWDEIDVMVTFESDWKKAKSILQEIADGQDDLHELAREHLREASSKYMIFYNTLTPRVYTTVGESGVRLQIRYLCEPRRRRLRNETFWESILDRFAAESDIELAYPTQRFIRSVGATGEATTTATRDSTTSESSSPFSPDSRS